MRDLLSMLSPNMLPPFVKDALKEEGIRPSEYIRYLQLSGAARERLRSEKTEWVERCTEFDAKQKKRARDRAEATGDELQVMLTDFADEIAGLFKKVTQKTGEQDLKANDGGFGNTFRDFFDRIDDMATGRGSETAASADERRSPAFPDTLRVVDDENTDGPEKVVSLDKERHGRRSHRPERSHRGGGRTSIVDQLEKIAALKKDGLLNDAEFEQAKKKILE